MFYSYPSYLGVPIFKADKIYMPQRVLGLTDGRSIRLQKHLPKDIAEFVLLHEEEHVKDMNATESEVDQRALQRFTAKNGKLTKSIKKLMKRRHGIGDIEKHFSLMKKEEKIAANNFINELYSDSNW